MFTTNTTATLPPTTNTTTTTTTNTNTTTTAPSLLQGEKAKAAPHSTPGAFAHYVEAAKWHLEAEKRYPVGSKGWAYSTAAAFSLLLNQQCKEAVKPEWWNDEGLKALSTRVLQAVPNVGWADEMRAQVLSGFLGGGDWQVGSRSAGDLKYAAALFDRAAAQQLTAHMKGALFEQADCCRNLAGSM